MTAEDHMLYILTHSRAPSRVPRWLWWLCPPRFTERVTWAPGQPVNWVTPGLQYRGHLFCGNCSREVPGCGCPRDCTECMSLGDYCGHLDPASPTYGAQNWWRP